MVTTHIRKAAGLCLALVFALPVAAFAAETRFEAHLMPTREDPRASGRASVQTDAGLVTLTLQVDNVASTDLAMVLVQGRFVGLLEIVDGVGALSLQATNRAGAAIPQVQAGSPIEVIAIDDDAVILHGRLRRQ
jgi:hypothetical protein